MECKLRFKLTSVFGWRWRRRRNCWFPPVDIRVSDFIWFEASANIFCSASCFLSEKPFVSSRLAAPVSWSSFQMFTSSSTIVFSRFICTHNQSLWTLRRLRSTNDWRSRWTMQATASVFRHIVVFSVVNHFCATLADAVRWAVAFNVSHRELLETILRAKSAIRTDLRELYRFWRKNIKDN